MSDKVPEVGGDKFAADEKPAAAAAQKKMADEAIPAPNKPAQKGKLDNQMIEDIQGLKMQQTPLDKLNEIVSGAQRLLQSAEDAAREQKTYARKLRPLTSEQQENLPKLIEKLGHPDYRTREAAQQEIKGIGMAAVPKLVEAINRNTDPEIRNRAQRLYGGNLNGHMLPEISKPDDLQGFTKIKQFNLPGLSVGDYSADQFKMKAAQTFADDPALTKKRIDSVEQALGLVATGKLALPTENIRLLRLELQNLRDIGPVCARLEVDQAQTALGAKDVRTAQTLMKSALKHDKGVAQTDEFLHMMVKSNVDHNDAEFMKDFVAKGGDVKRLAEVREKRQNQRNSIEQEQLIEHINKP